LIYEKLQEGLLNPNIVKAVQKNFKMMEEFLLEEIKAVKAAKRFSLTTTVTGKLSAA